MVFYVEDDENIRQLVIYALNNSSFPAQGFESGDELFEALNSTIPSVILLDIMLPKEDGFSILKRLKESNKFSSIPVIMLSAKGQEMDKVNALNNGADDYMVKPFGIMELMARIKAVLRRKDGGSEKTSITFQGLVIDKFKHTLKIDEKDVYLTNKEFDLLFIMISNLDMVFSREKLLEIVWGYEYCGDTRTVDVHIKTLRQKIGTYSQYVETVFGVGYKFRGSDV